MVVEVVAFVTLEPVLPPDNLAMDEGQFRTGFLPSFPWVIITFVG
jgi:hypothetical protein